MEAAAEDSQPACVVTDLVLPGADGMELQRALAWRYSFIFLTGRADVPAVVAAMSAGAIDFLEKPVLQERLFAAVHKGLAMAIARHRDAEAAAMLKRKMARLTSREREVMALVTTGIRNKQVAHYLGTTEKTIKAHRAHIMEKLELGSLAELVRYADQSQLDVEFGLNLAACQRSENALIWK